MIRNNTSQFRKLFYLRIKKTKIFVNLIIPMLIIGLELFFTYKDKDGIFFNFQTLGVYLLIWKIFVDLLTKTNFDQDRLAFQMHHKRTVFLTIILINLIIFLFPFLLYMAVSSTMNWIRGASLENWVANVNAINVILYILSLLLLYLLIWSMILNIKSTNNKVKKKLIIFCLLWIVFLFLPAIAVVNRIPTVAKSLSQNWSYFIPILNIINIAFNLLGNSWWKPIPFLVETTIILIFIWRKMMVHIKEWLCT